MLENAADLLLVVLGFGALIFIHELGHFLAARWAGIRVLTFAIGIGPTIVSYRSGLGWRRGSSEREYLGKIHDNPAMAQRLGSTEYTLKWVPLGGFVRMLGQEDLHPERISDQPDSYQSVAVWKRLVVISAGVVANLITAAAAFMAVFLIGLESQPATVGQVLPGSPASMAAPIHAPEGIGPGLEPGDRVIALDGEAPLEFNDLATGIAMTSPDRPTRLTVERPGVDGPLTFDMTPRRDPLSGLLSAGFAGPRSLTVSNEAGDDFLGALARDGYEGVTGGSTLVGAGVDGAELVTLEHEGDLYDIVNASAGRPVRLRFDHPERGTHEVVVTPVLDPWAHDRDPSPGVFETAEHVLGLRPCVAVREVPDSSPASGILRPGDVFARFGSLEFPHQSALISAIQASAGREVSAVVLRPAPDPAAPWQRVPVTLTVSEDGLVGFLLTPFMDAPPVLAEPAVGLFDLNAEPVALDGLGRRQGRAGSRVLSIAGQRVATMGELAASLKHRADRWLASTPDAGAEGDDADLSVPVTLELPMRDANGRAPDPVETTWRLTRAEGEALRDRDWVLPGQLVYAFEPESIVLTADNPWHALGMGLHRTKSAMLQVYLTIARITQGTVEIRHLSGPIGIARAGTILADRGVIWLLFFFGLISVNLAVVNFLPIPILDGGQFLFLIYEWVRGRPPPVPVQNALTLAGLVLIAALFIVVTFNDVRTLLGV